MQPQPTVKRLTCDADSFNYLMYHYFQERTPGASIFSHLEHLDLCTFNKDDDPHCLLAEAECLKSLYLECKFLLSIISITSDDTDTSTDNVWLPSNGPRHSQLGSLNSASCCTLTHLTYTLTFCLQDTGAALDDPYHTLLDHPLSRFSELQSLRINLIYHGNFHLDWDASFGPQWGRLGEAIGVHGAPPKLKEVAVVVHLRSRLNSGHNWDNAKTFRDRLMSSVYPAQFGALDLDRRDAESLHFSFEVKLSTGPTLTPGRGRDVLRG